MLLAPGRDQQIAKFRNPYTGYLSSRRKTVLYGITYSVTVDCKISFTPQTLTAFSEMNFKDTLDYIELFVFDCMEYEQQHYTYNLLVGFASAKAIGSFY